MSSETGIVCESAREGTIVGNYTAGRTVFIENSFGDMMFLGEFKDLFGATLEGGGIIFTRLADSM